LCILLIPVFGEDFSVAEINLEDEDYDVESDYNDAFRPPAVVGNSVSLDTQAKPSTNHGGMSFHFKSTVSKSLNEDGTSKTKIKASRSSFVRNLIYLNGEKFDFKGREYLIPIYDRDDKEVLLKTSRQVEKTTFLANNLVINAVCKPWSKSLYVSPSHTQTRTFSSEKLKPAIEKSPLIKQYFQDSGVSQQVFEKGFTNGSILFLRSAFRSADRCRGISAGSLCYDEIQDFLADTIPVIKECTSHFEDARVLYAGTPKSNQNPIEVLWSATTQNEWLVPCSACRKWNFLDEKNIAPTIAYVQKKIPPGPVCKYCSKPIFVPSGRWFSMKEVSPIVGYRIPQLMVPWICGLYDQWMKLLWKRDNYPISQFYNEVLGLSYDSSTSPITQEDLVGACCDDEGWDLENPTEAQLSFIRQETAVAGVDWGEGNDGSEKGPSGKIRNASYSVISVGYYSGDGIFNIVGYKKFMGKEVDPDYVVSVVASIAINMGIALVGVDWGHGWGVNNQLVRILGPSKVVQFQHLAKLRQKVKWDPIGFKYLLHRNFLMSEFFRDIKKALVTFPKWSSFEFYAKDFLAIYAEYSEYRREIKYDHRASEPDDCFHSSLYCKMTADVVTKKISRFEKEFEEERA
jgi:hypothetical protein